MRPLRICVFCSANEGLPLSFLSEADLFCQELARRGAELLYGGSRDGLMGHFADRALAYGVPVRGALTSRLDLTSETAHRGLTELIIVKDLFDRKRWFLQESDAFVVFPGGFGTLDEALEVITWKGLGELDKPIVFVNLEGFWDSTFAMFKDLASKKVIRPGALESFVSVTKAQEVFKALDGF